MKQICVAVVAFSTVALGLGGCSTPAPIQSSETVAPFVLSAAMKGGCLLPASETIDSRVAGSITLNVLVNERGSPTGAEVVKSSGRLERDRAFERAVMYCEFNPGRQVANEPRFRGQDVASKFTLDFAWSQGQQFLAVQRCFSPSYPPLSRRLGEQARVTVVVSRAKDGKFEYQASSVPHFERLNQASLDSVKRCIELNPQVRREMPVGQTQVPFTWRLEAL